MRVDGELVDSLLVGLSIVSVMPLNFEEVFLEDESSVGFFLGSPVDSILRLPISKGISLLLLVIVEGKEGNSGQGGNNKFFSHI